MNMLKDDKVDPRLVSLLDELKDTSARNPTVAAHARAQFLAEAVSTRDQQRHSLWTFFQQKEKFAMKLMMSVFVIVGLLFGGNATFAAAQNDLPNEPLYQLKLMSEDVNLWFVSDPVQQIETLTEQAQTRIGETAALAAKGITPPAELTVRAQQRIQRALQIAATLDHASQMANLQLIQTRLQTQEQLIGQLQQGNCTECAPVLQQTRDMLQIQLRDVENSLATPEAIQNPNQNQSQNQTQNQNQLRVTQTPQPTDAISVPQDTCTPALDGTGQQNRDGNLPASTPMQQNNQQNNQNGGGTQNGTGSGGGSDPSPGSGGQGGKP